MKGGDPTHREAEPDVANLSEREVVSNEEGKPVIWFTGERKCAVTWVSPVLNLHHTGGETGKK